MNEKQTEEYRQSAAFYWKMVRAGSVLFFIYGLTSLVFMWARS